MDYFERAKRLEEIPLLQKYHEEEKQLMKHVWEQQEHERVGNTTATESKAVYLDSLTAKHLNCWHSSLKSRNISQVVILIQCHQRTVNGFTI